MKKRPENCNCLTANVMGLPVLSFLVLMSFSYFFSRAMESLSPWGLEDSTSLSRMLPYMGCGVEYGDHDG